MKKDDEDLEIKYKAQILLNKETHEKCKIDLIGSPFYLYKGFLKFIKIIDNEHDRMTVLKSISSIILDMLCLNKGLI